MNCLSFVMFLLLIDNTLCYISIIIISLLSEHIFIWISLLTFRNIAWCMILRINLHRARIQHTHTYPHTRARNRYGSNQLAKWSSGSVMQYYLRCDATVHTCLWHVMRNLENRSVISTRWMIRVPFSLTLVTLPYIILVIISAAFSSATVKCSRVCWILSATRFRFDVILPISDVFLTTSYCRTYCTFPFWYVTNN